jgi:hypothetical protein
VSVSVAAESPALGGFYVPAFELKVQGQGLGEQILRDVTEVTYRDSVDRIDSFEIVVNNWDADALELKYIEPDGGSSAGADADRYTIFEPCNKTVEVSMGYWATAGT